MGGRAAVTLRPGLSALLLAAAAAAPAQPATAPAAGGAAASAPASLTGPARCRFAVPAGWDARQVRWTGDCRDGLAQGLGTLRALQGSQVLRIFYGRLKDGQPVLGAIELDGGYIAGRFENGQAVQDGDRPTLIQAFEAASAAAQQVAQHYQASGNPASARLYRQKARQLAQQLD
jgi:hypothetical protein